jgi:ABC-type sulfate transport system substrate-binding protein
LIRNLDTKKRDRRQINIFERKVYDNEKEDWRILTNKEIYVVVKKPTVTERKRLNRLRWFGHVQRMEENSSQKSVIYEFGNNKIER